MKHQIQLSAFVALAVLAVVFAKNNYLAEKPNFIKSCQRTDPGFNSCFGKIFNSVFREWRDGVPGLKSVGSADPLYIKHIGIMQADDNPLVHLNLDMVNMKVSGLSQVETKIVNFDLEKLNVKVIFRVPKIQIESDYKVKGRLLTFPLDSNGKASTTIDDYKVAIHLNLKLRDEFGYTFTDIDKVRLEFPDIGGFHMDLQNLFNGQKDLEESTNVIINQNWREFYNILAPALKDAVQTVVFDRFRKVFGYVPANYLIEDIQTAAEFNG